MSLAAAPAFAIAARTVATVGRPDLLRVVLDQAGRRIDLRRIPAARSRPARARHRTRSRASRWCPGRWRGDSPASASPAVRRPHGARGADDQLQEYHIAARAVDDGLGRLLAGRFGHMAVRLGLVARELARLGPVVVAAPHHGARLGEHRHDARRCSAPLDTGLSRNSCTPSRTASSTRERSPCPVSMMIGTFGCGKVVGRTHRAHELGAVHAGHLPVEQHDVGRQRADRLQARRRRHCAS